MKVSVAAKTMSHSMAAAIESQVCTGNNPLPSEAIHTAEFVADIDKLFDSFNGISRYPVKSKPLRCSITKKSRHITFWDQIIHKIDNWQFQPTNGGKIKQKMPVKTGWKNNIRAMKEVWKICKGAGMTFTPQVILSR
ncbi:hypothetical protein Zmor_011399 [Zophobas morio]|uniref:Transposable element P transposase-like GTP-binding insertion domain-containing protein n=1 Tax=Zophobas morio TaxID=2755281 RepID=A0AA38IQ29_9CUCU|nr:hypothetical protein Zmor_011399 [Zophobas morio]